MRLPGPPLSKGLRQRGQEGRLVSLACPPKKIFGAEPTKNIEPLRVSNHIVGLAAAKL